MCTQARLVQAGQASDWAGMPMQGAPIAPVWFKVASGQPAAVEVTIDPAAHGPQGVGPFQRGLTLTTADGKVTELMLTGTIVR